MSGVGGPWISVAISVDGVAVDATRGPLYGRELPNRHGPRGQTTPVPQPKLSPLPMGWGHLLGRSLDVTLERKPGTRVDVAIAIIENGEPQWRSNLATAGLPAGELHPTSLTDTVPVGLYLAPARSDADALTEARVAARLTQFF